MWCRVKMPWMKDVMPGKAHPQKKVITARLLPNAERETKTRKLIDKKKGAKMARTIYENIGVEFVLEEIDEYEAKIKVNDKTLIYISREQEAEFEEELKKLFDKYRI